MGRKKNQGSNSDPVERVPFKILTAVSVANTTTLVAPNITSVNLNPAIDARLASIADAFQWFRFVELKVMLPPAATPTADSDASVGYIPRVPNSAPTTHSELMSLPASAHKSRGQSVPAQMRVPRSILLGDAPIKWFQSIQGTEDTQWEIQGQYILAINTNTSSAGVQQTYIVEGICEFKGRSALTQTPFYKHSPHTCTTSPDPSIPAIVVGKAVYKLANA